MFSQDVIESKLAAIRNYLTRLESILPSVKVDSIEMYAVERLFQLIVDSAIDINTNIITHSDLETPNDYQGTFAIIAEGKIIPHELSDQISKSVGLRNILVHGYEKVDKAKSLSDIASGISQYAEYMKYIVEFMNKK